MSEQAENRVDQSVLEMRVQHAVEMLLEDERLRSNLTDEEYEPLLNWAVQQAGESAAATAAIVDEDAASELIQQKLNAIRSFMRTINSSAGKHVALSDSDLRRRIEQLAGQLYSNDETQQQASSPSSTKQVFQQAQGNTASIRHLIDALSNLDAVRNLKQETAPAQEIPVSDEIGYEEPAIHEYSAEIDYVAPEEDIPLSSSGNDSQGCEPAGTGGHDDPNGAEGRQL